MEKCGDVKWEVGSWGISVSSNSVRELYLHLSSSLALAFAISILLLKLHMQLHYYYFFCLNLFKINGSSHHVWLYRCVLSSP